MLREAQKNVTFPSIKSMLHNLNMKILLSSTPKVALLFINTRPCLGQSCLGLTPVSNLGPNIVLVIGKKEYLETSVGVL